MIYKHILFWSALMLLSAIPAYSVTDNTTRTGDVSLPSGPVLPRPNPHVSVTPIPEAMGLLVELPEGSPDTSVSLQSLTNGECIIIDVPGSCVIPIPGTSSAWIASIEQNGQTVMAEVVIL